MRERKFVQMVHMIQMMATSIYGKNPSRILIILQNQKDDDLGTWYVALGLWGIPSLFK